MNKLVFHVGGHELALNDLDFLQDAINEAFQGLAHRNAILSGLRIAYVGTAPTGYWTLTAGLVSIAGEVFYFAGESNWSSFTDPVLVIVESDDTSTGLSPVTYANSTSKNVHKLRRVVIQELAAQPAYYRIKDLEDFADPWHRVGDANDIVGGYNSGTGYGDSNDHTYGSSHEDLKIRKSGEYLELRGSMETDSFTNNQVAFTLPVVAGHNNYRPSKLRSISVAASSTGDGLPDHIMIITFDADGSIFVSKGTYTGSTQLRVHINARIPLK